MSKCLSLEQGNKAPGNPEESDTKIHEKSYDGEGARLHITHCSTRQTEQTSSSQRRKQMRSELAP